LEINLNLNYYSTVDLDISISAECVFYKMPASNPCAEIYVLCWLHMPRSLRITQNTVHTSEMVLRWQREMEALGATQVVMGTPANTELSWAMEKRSLLPFSWLQTLWDKTSSGTSGTSGTAERFDTLLTYTHRHTRTHTHIYIYTHTYIYIYTYVCVIYYFIGMHIIGMSRNDKIYRHVAICGYHVKNGMYRCMGMELPNISTHIIDDIDVGTCRVKWSPAISRLQMDEPLISLASAWAAWGVEPSGWNHRVWQGWKYQIIENWNLLFKQCLKSSSEFPWCYILWKRNLAVGGHGCFLSIFFGGNIAAK
jgi:hypothetical protein